MPSQGEVWVVDTSSIIEVRRAVEKTKRRGVYAKLKALTEQGHLVFPTEVLKELERARDPKPAREDLPLEWANEVAGKATSVPSFETVREVLAQVPQVCDPDKTTGVEEADPYVLACAVELKRAGKDVAIITQETRNLGGKLSLATAAGVLKIPALTMLPFLRSQGILG